MYEIKDLSEMTGVELHETIQIIKKQAGNKPYETLKAEVEVVLTEVNKRGKEIAKKHGKKFRPVTALEVLR